MKWTKNVDAELLELTKDTEAELLELTKENEAELLELTKEIEAEFLELYFKVNTQYEEKMMTEKEKRLSIIQNLQSKFQCGDASFELDHNCLKNKIYGMNRTGKKP